MTVEITTLQNGLRVASDFMPSVDTATICVAVSVGSRDEEPKLSGISHFLEHMAFKGTAKRTALQIAEEIDNVGGVMNAFTSKERTVYYIKVLRGDVPLAVDILADILQNSIFDEAEIEQEKGVILQELSAAEDSPDDVVFEDFYNTLYKEQPLGRPIIGNRETIAAFKRQDFVEYIGGKYNAGNMVISLAGNFSHAELLKLVEEKFTKIKPSSEVKRERAIYTGGEFKRSNEELSQVQFTMGFKGFSIYDEANYYNLKVAASILGSGMSSRLFQEVREKRGLVYAVSSFESSFADCGFFGVYAGTAPEKLRETRSVIEDELYKFAFSEEKGGVKQAELQKTINQLKAGLLMSSESTTSRAQRLAGSLLNFGRYIENAEIITKFSAVTQETLRHIFPKVIEGEAPKTVAIYGNI